MSESTTTLTYHDPARCFDGTPYEAAGLAVEQAGHVASLLDRALQDATVQVRNAYMSRRLDTGETDPQAILWSDTPQARALNQILFELAAMGLKIEEMLPKLKAIQLAASYDPKHPPKEPT